MPEQTQENQTAEQAVEQETADLQAEAPVGEPETPEADNGEARFNELRDQYARLAADFDNYRKRMAQEIQQARNNGAERAVMELLPVIDNLERAVSGLNESSDPKLLFQSFRLMQNQLNDGLSNVGLKKIPSVGAEFDPNFHEAVSQSNDSEYPENIIAIEMQGGYMLNDRVLRPAMVSVSSGQGKATTTPEPAGESETPASPGGESLGNPFRHAGP